MSDAPATPSPAEPPPSGAGVNVVLPRAVRRAAQRAEELQKQMHPPPEGEAPPVAEPVEPRLPLGDAPAEPPAPTQPPQDSWEQRYRTLQGKYDRELPQLQAQITSLERLIGSMRETPPAVAAPAATAPAGPSSLIPQEDIESYGPELIEASRRWAAAEFGSEIAGLKSQLAELKGSQTQLTEAQVRDKVQDQLSADPELANGRWQHLNTDQGFLNWLQEIDPLAGAPRFAMLQHAYSNGDAVRTGRFFKAYIAEHTVPPLPAPYPQTAVPPNGHAQAGGRQLDEWAAPGRAAGSNPPGNGATAERRVWTNREISQFYRERTDGKWRHREAEAYQLEADILAAGAEGRVRNV